MLMKQNRMLTYVCPECGLTHFENFNIFDFSGKREHTIECKCSKSVIRIVASNIKKYTIYISCLDLQTEYMFRTTFKNMWINPLTILKSNDSNIGDIFIGDEEKVMLYLDSDEKSKDILAEKIGFRPCYANSSVMLEALNTIHDIAEKNKIMCECGSKDVLMYTYKDRIVLQCAKCKCKKSINAKDVFDLKNISEQQEIILSEKNKIMP